jgi:hypothetical protein
MSDLLDTDYNGECFIAGGSGEKEVLDNSRAVYYAVSIPFSAQNNFDGGNQVHRDHLDLFYRINYYASIEGRVEQPANGAIRVPSAEIAGEARKIAYIRTLCARTGMFDFTGSVIEHRVRYTNFVPFSWDHMQAWARNYFNDQTIVITSLESARAMIDRVPNNEVDANWRAGYMEKHYDAVCTVAYMFRVRGHHWLEDMDDRYKSLWRKCLYDEDTPGLDWQRIAHDALHAIFPDDLDSIWRDAVDNGICAGTLTRRYSSLPAGIAGVAALKAGVVDLQMIVPRALEVAKAGVQHLSDIDVVISRDRWAGSVNRRFYNAAEINVDEAKLSALASIILSGLENLAPNSPLRKSKALQRIANNAAMTGALVGRMVMTAARSDAAAATFLPALPGVD